jgi:aspartyl aminopeptidase
MLGTMPIFDRAHTDDLLAFLAASPTPYHAVTNAAALLEAAGFRQLRQSAGWERASGGGFYAIRGAAIIAWYLPEGAAAHSGFRIVGAHTDSPNLRVKPLPDTGSAGFRQVGVELYGGPLLNSWLDRDLGLAGRLSRYDGSSALVDVHRPLLRVPQLAIHLDRAVNQGLTLDPQQHLLPVWGLGEPGGFLEFVAAKAGVAIDDVAGHDLVVYDLTPPATLGGADELFAAGRLDNLVSVHAGLSALLEAQESATVPVLVAFDHEEVGSASATGAAGPLLETVLTRLAGGFDARAEVFAASRALSCDVTHAAHPNYQGHHDPVHRALPNGGPALKVNANQRYATDAPGAAAWARACRDADVPNQVFVSRNTVPCGSTWGRSSRRGWASGRWTSGSRCCRCTRRGSCAGSTTRRTSSVPPQRSSSIPADHAPGVPAVTAVPVRRAGAGGNADAGQVRSVTAVADDIDTGLFGPHSVTWRVHLEPVLYVGGLRALILQALHPWVMLGTYQNSALFDPAKAFARFVRTAEFVGIRTFGTTSEVEAAAGRVRRIHAKLRGHDPATGRAFRLDDPQGLLWVHCGEIDSYADVAVRAGILNDADADRYIAESARAAEVVGAADAPRSRAEMKAYFDEIRPRLRLTDEAITGTTNLMTARMPAPVAVKLTQPPIAALGFASMPRWARRMYGSPGLPTTDLSTTLALKALRATLTRIPGPPEPPHMQRARRLMVEAGTLTS